MKKCKEWSRDVFLGKKGPHGDRWGINTVGFQRRMRLPKGHGIKSTQFCSFMWLLLSLLKAKFSVDPKLKHTSFPPPCLSSGLVMKNGIFKRISSD